MENNNKKSSINIDSGNKDFRIDESKQSLVLDIQGSTITGASFGNTGNAAKGAKPSIEKFNKQSNAENTTLRSDNMSYRYDNSTRHAAVKIHDSKLADIDIGNTKGSNKSFSKGNQSENQDTTISQTRSGSEHDESNSSRSHQPEEQQLANSKTRSGSDNYQSTSARISEAVPPASDLENSVFIALAGQPEEDIRGIMDVLRSLAVYKEKDFRFLQESDLIQGGIKLVHARKLFQYFAEQNY